MQFANISRGLLLGLVFNIRDLVVKLPSDSDVILLISRQPCLESKCVADKKSARGFQNALGALFTQAKQKIVNIQKNKHDLTSLLLWLNTVTSFINSPTSKPTPTVSQEQPAPVSSPGPEADIEMEDCEAMIKDLTMNENSEMPGVVPPPAPQPNTP